MPRGSRRPRRSAAAKTGKPVKLRLPRETDMIATGKRHGFDYRYTVGFDDEGRVLALDAMLAADAGWSLDMTPGVVARALTHIDNAYWIPHFRAVGYSCKTNKQSNTAFRGFGGPQGVLVMEDASTASLASSAATPTSSARSISTAGPATRPPTARRSKITIWRAAGPR